MIKKNIPSFITCLNLICGLLAILSNDLRIGMLLIVLGGVFDVLDGLVARMLNLTSDLGKELDSLADIVTFGVAPAVLYYRIFSFDGSIFAFIAPIFIVVGGAWRLARFNVTISNSKYFEGMAIPATGLFIAGLVLASYYDQQIIQFIKGNIWYSNLIALTLALLNISKIKMFSFKQLKNNNLVQIYFAIITVLAIILFYYIPYTAIPVLLSAYVLIALIDHFILKSELR